MRLEILLPLLMAGAIICLFAGCQAARKRTVGSEQLPASCTLLAMAPEERSVHQPRLNDLRKAGRLERETVDGFEFTVDLRQMSAKDLQLWMENEQKCCSFLRIKTRSDEVQQRTHVTVECPKDLFSQVIETFGLRGPKD
jgi:hypothetical protein